MCSLNLTVLLDCFQARIVAMTCTYAAINRRKLIDLDFKYDRYVNCINVIVHVAVGNDVKQLSLSYS
jgi:hypothetical protein